MPKSKYNHSKVEERWQKEWEKRGLCTPDVSKAKKPFYNLWMFPYPSAEGLHAGHAFASTGSDVYGRFQRMNKKDVFQPIGYDSFGIHSENYAISINENPHKVVERTTKHYGKQLMSLGHGYDWTRTVTTSDPDYYKWTQWLFLKMWEKSLAYRKMASVNFCPSCKTVLADEQVMSPRKAGKEPKNANGEVVEDSEELRVCERCGTIVEKRELEQWFFKITDYAERLLEGLNKIDWSERVVSAQRNWIGKSEGVIINFKKENGEVLSVFTTRPDTLNAVTFIALSDDELYNKGLKEKTGEFTGEYAINPLNEAKLPIWKTNYVAPGYGTGSIMGVPAHDERDADFAKKYQLDTVDKDPDPTLKKKVVKEGWGEKHTHYHLRDWLVSRQRYWGAPIPMINCPKCSWQPVPEKDLPVLLPEITDFKPEGTGKGPLATHKEFYEVKCPNCGGVATRETDVMDTFVDSSWYFLRYPSVGIDKAPFDPAITKKWLPVNLYFGGAEHSVLHLMYARFVTMALYDLKLLDFEEPFVRFFAHGLMIKDGAKMSKSRGNVVNPDEYVKKYGADTMRLYVMFMGPMDGSPDFRDTGIEGMAKFIKRVWTLFDEHKDTVLVKEKDAKDVLTKMHQTIKKVTEDINEFHYNTAIASTMEFVNLLYEKVSGETKKAKGGIRCAEWDEALRVLAQLLAPLAPHMAEEAWVSLLGQKFSVHTSSWPEYNNEFTTQTQATIALQVNGKLRGTITLEAGKAQEKENVIKLALKEEGIKGYLEGKSIKNTIFVPGKIVNFVIK